MTPGKQAGGQSGRQAAITERGVMMLDFERGRFGHLLLDAGRLATLEPRPRLHLIRLVSA